MPTLDRSFNSGGANLVQGAGKPGIVNLLRGLYGVATLAALKALVPDMREDQMIVRVAASAGQQLHYKWVDASTLTADDLLVVAGDDAPTAGRWVFAGGPIDMAIAVTYALADAAVLYTMPTGFRMRMGVSWWEITTSFTGGSSSAIGLSSSNTAMSTKGDLLGGASGDVAAGLLSTGNLAKGTVGAKIHTPGSLLVAGNTIRFDRITDAFTAGAGNAHVVGTVIATP